MQSKSSLPLNKIITEYLPKELIPADWFWRTNKSPEKNLEILFDTGKLGMFPSAVDLLKDLRKFQYFPRSYKKFEFDIKDQFKNQTAVYKSFQREKYMYKSDLYSILYQSIARITPFGNPAQAEIIKDLLSFYLEMMESKYALNAEMTRIPDKELTELLSDFEKTAIEFAAALRLPAVCRPDLLSQHWNDILRLDKNNESHSQFQMWMEKTFEEFPREGSKYFYSHVTDWIKIAVKKMDDFISNNSEHFLPGSMAPGEKAIIRLFNCKKFGDLMITHEVIQSLKQANMDVSSIEKEIMAMPKLSTWTLRDFNKKMSLDVKKNVIFILHRSTVTEFRTTPVPTIEGGYCTFAYDALMAHLMDMIVAKKVFRVMRAGQIPLMDKYIESLLKYFDANRGIYFMDLEEIKAMENEWNLFFNANFKDQSKDIREIRNVRKTGFSTNDVVKELRYLKVDQCFPSITTAEGTNEIVHFGLPKMYRMIKNSQKRLFLDKYPKIFEFVHSQGECEPWRPLECPCCMGPKKEEVVEGKTGNLESVKAEVLAAEDVDKAEPAQNKDCLEKVIPEHLVTKTADEAAESHGDSSPETESGTESHAHTQDSIDKVTPVTKERKQKEKKAKKTSEHVAEPPKESQACPKCIRASEFHRETNEKLRLSKVEVKALKKELTEIQKVNEEKDERIKLLERKLLEQETRLKEQELQLKEKDAQIEKLKIVSLEKTTECEKQEEIIDSLKDKIYEQEGLISRMKSHFLKSTPIRSNEETENVNDHFVKLLDIQKTLESENPIKKVEEFTSTLTESSINQQVKYLAKSEMKIYQIQLDSFTKVLEGNIKLVQGNQNITMDQIPDLLDFPQFSQEFRDAFKKTVKKVAPVICRSLLKNPPEEPECSICLEIMYYEDETSLCGTCNWIYHKGCMNEWLKEKKTCPSCRSLNDEEFPRLS